MLLGIFAVPPLRAQEAGKPAPAPDAVLDRVIAVVNGDAILESDIDEERRFENIQPYRGRDDSRESALDRIVNRTLIQQEARLQPDAAVTDEELDRQLSTLRNDIPACKQFRCETDEGWQKYLAANGFTPAEFRERWRSRMRLLRFIQIRFRGGVHITDDQIRDYYEKTMLPEYERQKVTPPRLETISQRIEEVLLQQQVNVLLRDWLASLRTQGSVRILRQDEAAP